MAKVLLVGSRADMTRYVAARLEAEGWEVVPAVGPAEGLRQLALLDEVDAMVVGGPAAWAARRQLTATLHARHPYAPVVFPNSPDGLGAQLRRAFGIEAN